MTGISRFHPHDPWPLHASSSVFVDLRSQWCVRRCANGCRDAQAVPGFTSVSADGAATLLGSKAASLLFKLRLPAAFEVYTPKISHCSAQHCQPACT